MLETMYPVYRKGKHANKKNNIPLKNSPPPLKI